MEWELSLAWIVQDPNVLIKAKSHLLIFPGNVLALLPLRHLSNPLLQPLVHYTRAAFSTVALLTFWAE